MISQCGKQHRVGAPKDPLDKVAFFLFPVSPCLPHCPGLEPGSTGNSLGTRETWGHQREGTAGMRGHQPGFGEPGRPLTSSWGQQKPQKGAPWGQCDLERSFGYQGESGWRDKSGGQEPDAVQPERRPEARMALRVARKGPVPQSFGSQEQRQMGEGREREGSRTMVGVRAWPGARELGNSGGPRGKQVHISHQVVYPGGGWKPDPPYAGGWASGPPQ